jgi:hypothetical protein
MNLYFKAYKDGATAALSAMEAVLHDKTSPEMMQQMIDRIRKIILESGEAKEVDRLQ